MNYNIQVSGEIVSILFLENTIANREILTTLLPGISGVLDSETYIMSEEYSFWFTSTYCPIFSTPTKIKLEVGPVADALVDDVIYRMLHKNSLDAVDIYNVSHGTKLAYDYWGCTWHDVPIQLRRYVECKTAYDILALLKQLNASNNGGDQLKTLGDMTIKYGGSGTSNPAIDAPSKMKSLFDCWNESLRGIQAIKIAVKGYYDSSKGFSHPVREPQHNRVIRPVIRNSLGNEPGGPWVNGWPWRRYDI